MVVKTPEKYDIYGLFDTNLLISTTGTNIRILMSPKMPGNRVFTGFFHVFGVLFKWTKTDIFGQKLLSFCYPVFQYLCGLEGGFCYLFCYHIQESILTSLIRAASFSFSFLVTWK